MTSSQIIVFALVAVACGGVFYALFYPYLSGEAQAEKRHQMVLGTRTTNRATAAARADAHTRRMQVAGSMKELEARQKRARTPPLATRIAQAGLSWSKQTYYLVSVVLGLLFGVMLLVGVGSPLLAASGAVMGGLAVPSWLLRFLIKRRQARFIEEFPNAIDVIVRGVKAGLPLGDCIRVVANDSPEPVKSEFRSIIDTQAIGVPMDEAVQRMQERLGLPEANFFAIVIAIQAKSGGSLSDALGNLSRVLRERKKMRGKIKAMSMEAKASGWIIGSLPAIVAFMVNLTSPGYMSVLWQTPTGMMMLAASGFWMLCGILVMRKMINFDF